MTSDPLYRTGDRVRVAYNGQTVDASVMLASANGRSLMLAFDGVLRDLQGGYFVGKVPLLYEDGAYRDLVNNETFTLTLI